MRERIRKIISYYNLTDRAFSNKCSIKQNTFSNQMNGQRDLSLPTIYAILDNCKEISAEWLLRGNGNMLIEEQEENCIEKLNAALQIMTDVQMQKNKAEMRIAELEAKLKSANEQLSMLKNELSLRKA